MSDAPRPAHDCATMAAELAALEHAAGDAASLARRAALVEHAERCAPCARRHGERLARLEGLCALRSRALPHGALRGLSAGVLERLRTGTAAGGMSPAFLDAPRSLTRWRRVAVAASLLLGVGAGLIVSGRLSWNAHGPGGRDPGLRDARDTLLLRLDDRRRDAPSEDLAFTPVLFPGHGQREFWAGAQRPPPRVADDAADAGE